jgi:hypothetical protein
VPIGICGLLKRESMKDIGIGFAFLEFLEHFWAKGYAYESAAVMDYARTSLGLKRIAAPSGCWGNWSREGRPRFPGQERETSLYALEG